MLMNCPTCSASNPESLSYCGECGEPLTILAAANKRRKEVREKKALEIELTEAVAKRLATWSKLLIGAVTLLLAGAGYLIGKEIFDLHKAISAGRREVATSVSTGVRSINGAVANVEKTLGPTVAEINGIQKDADKYKNVNRQIFDLQTTISKVAPSVVDLGKSTLRVGALGVNGTGPAVFSFGTPCGNSTLAPGMLGSICIDGIPLTLEILTPGQKKRPVGSISDRGFQDLSESIRPTCDAQTRGTFYVDKGRNGQGDKAIVCLRADGGTFSWHQFAASD